MKQNSHFDLIVIGSGPAGQKAAVQAAKAGRRVAMVERDRYVGGSCVHRGTIPSKTLRESALHLAHLRRSAELFSYATCDELEMELLTERMDIVVRAHDEYINNQLERNNVQYVHGRAKFIDNKTVNVSYVAGGENQITADYFVVASGSSPRAPEGIPIDHEHVYDSDSILSMIYLPKSLLVLGGGVIASEYASIFATLGVKVTMIDSNERPLGFLDPDLTGKFCDSFAELGGEFIGCSKVASVSWDDVSSVVVKLEDGTSYRADKLLCAAGRVANVKGLGIENIGITLNSSGLIPVDANYCTCIDNIYAAGDVIGHPSLASASMEEGRRAACHALGLDLGKTFGEMPFGIYGIPELSSVGQSEKEAIQKYGSAVVGRANFEEIARGQISGIQDGMLKMVADPKGKLLGVQIVGEGATELVHIGQMALLNDGDIDIFIDNIFNFPTLAEAYRVAALNIRGQLG